METSASRINVTTPDRPAGWRSLAVFGAVLGLFLVSGACGLLYQVVWTRKLVLLFGTTAYAVSTVLCVFFLGLGLGSLWGGRLADRSRNPLALYGVFEVFIGVWAALFLVLIWRGEALVVDMLQAAGGSRALGVVLRIALATALLIVPVTLMGATLPLLARHVTRRLGWAGGRVGALYSINTFGAMAGCALAGFVLLPAVGYTWTTLAGAAANGLAGVVALLLARHVGAPPPADDEEPLARAQASHPARARLLAAVLGIEGFVFLASEVLWTRLLTLLFTGTTYAYTTMLVCILFGVGAGGAIGAVLAQRSRNPLRLFGLVEGLSGAACLLAVGLFARAPDTFHEIALSSGYRWEGLVRAYFVSAFLVLLAPTVVAGMTFPIAVKALADARERLGRDVGLLYGANTFGGVVGAAAGGFFIIPLFGTTAGMVGLSLLLAVAGLLVLIRAPGRGRLALGAAVVGCLAGAALLRPFANDPLLTLTRRDIPDSNELLAIREGVEGTVAVSQEPEEASPGFRDSGRVLWINGVQATASIERGVKMNRFQGALPLLFGRPIERRLLMCFGSGITAGTLALHPFEQFDVVEISADVLEAASWFEEDNLGVLNNPDMRFIVDDGRNYLLTTNESYDFITFEPMPLALAGVSTFYTREYYELCRQRLRPGGMVSQWIPLHSLNPDVVRALVRTFTSVFPEYVCWLVNADLFLIGAEEPLRLDYATAVARLSQPSVRAALADVGLADPVELLSHFLLDKANVDRFAASSGDGPWRLMTDDRPWAEFVAPRLMNAREVDASLRLLRPLQQPATAILDRDTIPAANRAEVLAALERRTEARRASLEALQEYYSPSIGGTPEDGFIEALRIDPGDRTSAYYLRQIASQRIPLYLRWEDFEEAESLMERALAVAPTDPYLESLAAEVREAAAAADNAD